jgi:hypothetical protein
MQAILGPDILETSSGVLYLIGRKVRLTAS